MDLRGLAIVGFAALAGMAAGWLTGRRAGAGASALLALAVAGAAAGLLLLARGRQGWDGLGLAIAALVMVLPAAPGVMVGGWLGARRP